MSGDTGNRTWQPYEYMKSSYSSLLRTSGQTLQSALDLLYPPHCPICQRGGVVLCMACLSSIPPLPAPICQLCGNSLIANGICRGCRFAPPGLNGVRTFGTFRGALRACIHALKYEGNRRLGKPLGLLLARAYRDYGLRCDILVPVPLHGIRQRQRGFNQAQLLAESCSNDLRLPLCSLLVRTRHTPAQTTLTAAERRQNVANAFHYSSTHPLAGSRILLIDDVCTTGATLESCAAPLFAAGARAVYGLTLARPSAQT